MYMARGEDCVRYEIEPPQELADRCAQLSAQGGRQREVDRRAHVERIVKRFVEKQAWWEREFPKDDRQPPKEEANVRARGDAAQGALASPVERMVAPRAAMTVPASAAPVP